MAIVIGGPVLTLWLARFGKRKVLIGLMGLFIVGNLIAAFATDYTVLLISRVVAGLTQESSYGIGAMVATRLVGKSLEGQAVGQMFAGLTLANVLGVPGGSWIGTVFGWHATFFVVTVLGVIAAIAILTVIPHQGRDQVASIRGQPRVFSDRNLLASLFFTVLAWVGFMTCYGYIAPIAEQVSGFARIDVTWILVIVGIGLVIGNILGGKSTDANLRLSLILWPLAMSMSLIVVGFAAPFKWFFLFVAFVFGVTSSANVPPTQMRVMKYGRKAPELAVTANISAFNIANALGGVIGGVVVDGRLGPGSYPIRGGGHPHTRRSFHPDSGTHSFPAGNRNPLIRGNPIEEL